MNQIPSYLSGSYYAQKHARLVQSGVTVPELLPSKFLDDKAVSDVVSLSQDHLEVKFTGNAATDLTNLTNVPN